jgi:diphthamide biosynthesis enzyme Dph1/Dph2-like protein
MEFKELLNKYDLELGRIVREIKKKKARRVLIQLPDAFKINATDIVDELEKHTKAEFYIWMGSCYGACDIPNINEKDFDLVVQFGHSEWL